MDGIITIGTKIDTKSFDAQIEQMSDKIQELEYLLGEFEPNTEEYQKINVELEKAKNKLGDLISKQNELNRKKGIKNIVDGIGESMSGIIKKVGKWALALFAVRSVYSAIRGTISILSQHDDQLATDIEYIRWALATTLKPIIEWVLGAIKTIISLVGSLIHAIFGVNIFANSTADAFVRAKKSLGGANKEAKQLQKTLAGFDEMNILQDNGGTSVGGGGGGITTPSFDVSKLMKIPNLNKIIDFWKNIFKFWEKDWKDVFNSLGGKWGTFLSGLLLIGKGTWDTLKGLIESIVGIVEIVVGTVWGILTGNWDLVKKGFETLIKGIKDILIGAITIIEGILLTLFGLIKGILLEIWDVFYKLLIKPIMDVLNKASSFVNGIATNIVNGVINIFSSLPNFINNYVIQPISNFFNNLWGGLKNGVYIAVNGIKEAFKGISNWINDNAVQPIVNLFTDLGNKIISVFKTVFDYIKDKFEKLENSIRKTSHTPTLVDTARAFIKRTFGFAKGGIVVPKLASGGIINQPGRGVPLASAIGGERGAEGVIPLTDSQQMALLGEAIGKYITVNAQMNNYMNGRLISRELQKVQSDNDFAYNR